MKLGMIPINELFRPEEKDFRLPQSGTDRPDDEHSECGFLLFAILFRPLKEKMKTLQLLQMLRQ
jgi:hypothetical protein